MENFIYNFTLEYALRRTWRRFFRCMPSTTAKIFWAENLLNYCPDDTDGERTTMTVKTHIIFVNVCVNILLYIWLIGINYETIRLGLTYRVITTFNYTIQSQTGCHLVAASRIEGSWMCARRRLSDRRSQIADLLARAI